MTTTYLPRPLAVLSCRPADDPGRRILVFGPAADCSTSIVPNKSSGRSTKEGQSKQAKRNQQIRNKSLESLRNYLAS